MVPPPADRPRDQASRSAPRSNSSRSKSTKGRRRTASALADWTARGEINIDRQETEIKNVAAVLEGAGPHRDQTIVIGAHYDHLGHGEPGTADPGTQRNPQRGRRQRLGRGRLDRSRPPAFDRGPKNCRGQIIFLAFTGEERGLLGSANYVRDPLVPLDKTIAMLNMDMVGRLTDNKLIVYGTDTATEFEGLVERLGKQLGLRHRSQSMAASAPATIRRSTPSRFRCCTSSPAAIPTITARPTIFPRSTSTACGAWPILVADVAAALAEASDPPHFQESNDRAGRRRRRPALLRQHSRLFQRRARAMPWPASPRDSPADQAGFKAKDVIIRFGDSQIGNLEDFDSALRKYKAGDKVPVVVRRDGKEVTLTVTLDPPK